jgi:tRNA threonylcarbamoyladenosine biosynthesis protein TsaB
MLILALDTTTRGGSLALVSDGHLLAAVQGEAARTHAERLPGAIADLLERLGRRPDEVTHFAVAAGPGSFTGLRIGIATIQGLAFALRRPVVAIPVLDALGLIALEWWGRNHAHGRRGSRRCSLGACLDAHRRELFTALWISRDPEVAPGRGYRSDPLADLVQTEGPAVGSPREAFARWARLTGGEPVVLAGDGALEYSELARAVLPQARVVRPLPPLAPAVARLAVARLGSAGPPHAVKPVYVRRPDAEVARDRAALPGRVVWRSGDTSV